MVCLVDLHNGEVGGADPQVQRQWALLQVDEEDVVKSRREVAQSPPERQATHVAIAKTVDQLRTRTERGDDWDMMMTV